jgi:hypothetical protein
VFLAACILYMSFDLPSIFRKTFAKEPLVSPDFLDKNRIDVATLKEETYKEVLWYKESHKRYQRTDV